MVLCVFVLWEWGSNEGQGSKKSPLDTTKRKRFSLTIRCHQRTDLAGCAFYWCLSSLSADLSDLSSRLFRACLSSAVRDSVICKRPMLSVRGSLPCGTVYAHVFVLVFRETVCGFNFFANFFPSLFLVCGIIRGRLALWTGFISCGIFYAPYRHFHSFIQTWTYSAQNMHRALSCLNKSAFLFFLNFFVCVLIFVWGEVNVCLLLKWILLTSSVLFTNIELVINTVSVRCLNTYFSITSGESFTNI